MHWYHMEGFSFLEIDALAPMLSASFAIASLLIAAFCIFSPRPAPASTKLLGSLMVLALSFGANSAEVYALAIFIIATLVTDLDFLEKLAAIFWKNDKYWQYRIEQISAADAEQRTKEEAKQEAKEAAKQEAKEAAAPPSAGAGAGDDAGEDEHEDVGEDEGAGGGLGFSSGSGSGSSSRPDAGKGTVDTYVQQTLTFETAVQKALASDVHPFKSATVLANVALKSPSRRIEVDAVVETPSADYIIEIKYGGDRVDVIHRAAAQLRYAISTYRSILIARNVEKRVFPVLIVPANSPISTVRKDSIFVLKFDQERGKFINRQQFVDAIGLGY